jgi:hypothetical protein
VSNRRAVTAYPLGPLAEYLFVDVADLSPDQRARHEALLARGDYAPVAERGGMTLLRRR